MTVFEWLQSPSIGGRTILQYLAELIAVNKGTYQITEYGRVERGPGPYGRIGLTEEEAIHLAQISGCLNGFFLALGQADVPEVQRLIKEEIDGHVTGRKVQLQVPGPEDVARFGRQIIPHELEKQL